MPRKSDDDNGLEFDPEDYGWTQEQWDELKEIYGYDTDEEMLEEYPELADFSDWMDELDYIDDLDTYEGDEDFYSTK